MKKRNFTFAGFQRRNLLGYELDENDTFNLKQIFACQSDCVDLMHYTRKIDVYLELRDNKVVALKNGTAAKTASALQKALYNHCMNNILNKANDLSIQGSFLRYRMLYNICCKS